MANMTVRQLNTNFRQSLLGKALRDQRMAVMHALGSNLVVPELHLSYRPANFTEVWVKIIILQHICF